MVADILVRARTGMQVPPLKSTRETDLCVVAYFDSIATEFEIKERIETINKKIDYAQEVQSTLRALLTEVSVKVLKRQSVRSIADTHVQASGHRMEMIIILLIAVEVVIVGTHSTIYYTFHTSLTNTEHITGIDS